MCLEMYEHFFFLKIREGGYEEQGREKRCTFDLFVVQ